MTVFRRILVPIDFGRSSERALATAIALSQKLDASVVPVHTYEIPTYAYAGMAFEAVDLLATVEDAAKQQFETALVALRRDVPAATGTVRRGIAWQEILAAIESSSADLVVMGTHGRHGLARALLGSVAEKTVRLSRVPVLTVRAASGAT